MAIQSKLGSILPRHAAFWPAYRGALDYDRGGEIAVNLGELYGYSIRKLFAANVNIDVAPEHVSEVKSLLEPIAEAWKNMDLSKPTTLMAV